MTKSSRDGSEVHPPSYVVRPFPMEVRPGIDLDRARHLDAEIEDDHVLGRAAGTS